MKVHADAVEEPPPGLVARARQIWAESFGAARTTTGRATLGVRATVRLQTQRAQSQGALSGATWLTQRRQKLGAAVAAQKQCLSGEPRLLTARDKGPKNKAWTKEHEAGLQHQQQERLKRACAATDEGTAKVSAVSATDLEDFRRAVRKQALSMASKKRRQLVARAEPRWQDLEGQRVFVDASALQELDKPAGAWAALRAERGLHVVAERSEASIIVVVNPADPGDRNGLVASMLGGRLCTPSFLAPGKGAALQLHSALRMPRCIFISAACQAKHAVVLNLMKSVGCGEEASRWRFFTPSTERDFLDQAARRASKAEKEMVTLVLPTEREAFATFPGVGTVREFVRRIHKPDWGRSHMGYCKR